MTTPVKEALAKAQEARQVAGERADEPSATGTDRQQFLWMRSVQISAFEAMTEEEDAALWAEALRAADLLFGPEE